MRKNIGIIGLLLAVFTITAIAAPAPSPSQEQLCSACAIAMCDGGPIQCTNDKNCLRCETDCRLLEVPGVDRLRKQHARDSTLV